MNAEPAPDSCARWAFRVPTSIFNRPERGRAGSRGTAAAHPSVPGRALRARREARGARREPRAAKPRGAKARRASRDLRCTCREPRAANREPRTSREPPRLSPPVRAAGARRARGLRVLVSRAGRPRRLPAPAPSTSGLPGTSVDDFSRRHEHLTRDLPVYRASQTFIESIQNERIL
jgi:hypothetical protein